MSCVHFCQGYFEISKYFHIPERDQLCFRGSKTIIKPQFKHILANDFNILTLSVCDLVMRAFVFIIFSNNL